MERRSGFKRIGDKIHKKKVKYNVHTIQAKRTDTASTTYDVVLQENMASGKGSLETKKGVAKKSITKAGVNSSANNIGLKEDPAPRMLARQVASWKVARSLDLRVLSTEKYALHQKRTEDGVRMYAENGSPIMEMIGVSAMVPNARSLSAETDYHLEILKDQNKTPLEREQYFYEHIFTPKIQKQLSDLQLIDALTGQTDRHHGNIFIDTENQKIYGIDNDQSFINNKNTANLHAKNSLVSFKMPSRQNKYKYLEYDETRQLEYAQEQIDVMTAVKVLEMDSKRLRELLEDRVGRAYGEYLTDDEINAAEKRLEAIKRKITQLNDDGKLINKWGHNTFMDSITKYGEVMPFLEGDSPSINGVNQRYQNYIAREIYGLVHVADPGGTLEFLDYENHEGLYEDLYGENLRVQSSANLKVITKLMTRDDVLAGRAGLTEDEREIVIAKAAKASAQLGEGYEGDENLSSRKIKARARKARARKARARKARARKVQSVKGKEKKTESDSESDGES